MLGIVDDLDSRDFAGPRSRLQARIGRSLHGRDCGFGHGARGRRAWSEVRRVCGGGAILHLLVRALMRARAEHLAWRRGLGVGERCEIVHVVARIMGRVGACVVGGEDGRGSAGVRAGRADSHQKVGW